MTRHATSVPSVARAGFSLIELLAATVIVSVLLAALCAVIMTAFNMRAHAEDRLGETLTLERVAELLKQDIGLMVAPSGVLAGAMVGQSDEESGGVRADSLEFYSASGVLSDAEPWGAVQKVVYELAEPEDGHKDASRDLTRTVTRNLLASVEEEPAPIVILHGVKSLAFSYYDGDAWQDTWDSAQLDNKAPEAVGVRIEMAPDEDGRTAPPIELVCEIVPEAASDSEDSSTAGGTPEGSTS